MAYRQENLSESSAVGILMPFSRVAHEEVNVLNAKCSETSITIIIISSSMLELLASVFGCKMARMETDCNLKN